MWRFSKKLILLLDSKAVIPTGVPTQFGTERGSYFLTDLSVAPSASVEMTKQHSDNRQKAGKFTFENNVFFVYHPIVNTRRQDKLQGKAMCESINVENKKQNHQKPPLSVGRIAGEILAGTALGLVALLVVHVTCIVLVDKGCYAAFGFLAFFAIFFPPLYGLGSVVGVYLVGSRGKQTGSCLATLAGGFAGTFVMTAVLFSFLIVLLGAERILLAPVLLIPPIFATIGFNLRRRYKEQPSS